jgi:hypothetical protein
VYCMCREFWVGFMKENTLIKVKKFKRDPENVTCVSIPKQFSDRGYC